MIMPNTNTSADVPPAFFSSNACPVHAIAIVGRQHLGGDLLDRGDRLARAVARRRVGGDLDRGEIVEARDDRSGP